MISLSYGVGGRNLTTHLFFVLIRLEKPFESALKEVGAEHDAFKWIQIEELSNFAWVGSDSDYAMLAHNSFERYIVEILSYPTTWPSENTLS